MNLPYSQARRTSQADVAAAPVRGSLAGAPAASVSRLSTSHSSNRPISTSSRSFSISSKNSSLPEKQLLSRYRHVYAGKGGWFQGRSSFTPQSNYSAGQNGRQLDVYRKELILRLSKDIFESSKSKIASADFVVSNKVAGDSTHDVIRDATQKGDDTALGMTSVNDDNPLPSKSARVQREEIIPHVTSRSEKYRPSKFTYNGLSSTRHYRNPSGGLKNSMTLNLRAGNTSSALETNNCTQQRYNAASAAAGYRPTTVVVAARDTSGIDVERTSTARQEANDDETQHGRCGELSQGSAPLKQTDQKEKLSPNQIESSLAHCPALNGSNAIHLDGLESRNIASTLGDSNVAVQINYANQARHINGEQNGIQQSGIHKDKGRTEGRESKCLIQEDSQELKPFIADGTKGHFQQGQTPADINNNQLAAKDSGKHGSQTKSAKKDKSTGKDKLESGKNEEKLLDNILGEIQFNVLRQRSFIRVPKKAAKVANALETARLTSDVSADNGVESHRLLSRMSFSKEARDALLETRKEMHLEQDVDLDKFNIRKLHSRGNKRPSSPRLVTPPPPRQQPPPARSSSSSGSSAIPAAPHVITARESPRKHSSTKLLRQDAEKPGKQGFTRNNSTGRLEVPILLLDRGDGDKEKSPQCAEPRPQLTRRTSDSRSTDVSTTIDLVAAIPREQQESYMRYSTNMSRDTPRANQRAVNTKTTKATPGALLTPRAHVNSDKQNGFLAQKPKVSYTVPLKSGVEHNPSDVKSGLTAAVGAESIKSDWESQYRATSKYGLATEKSFQITPPGWDERYKDLAAKNNNVKQEKEADWSLADVKKEAIEKCSDWLQRCN